MKSTLICVHVMPKEIELFERFMTQYKQALLYLDSTDNVTIKASLNLNPELTNWEESELKPDYFIQKFNSSLQISLFMLLRKDVNILFTALFQKTKGIHNFLYNLINVEGLKTYAGIFLLFLIVYKKL